MLKLPYEVAVGTEVTLIGRDRSEYVTMDEIAERLDTINYEIPCLISSRVPRVYKKGGKTIGMKNSILQL
jgi:alanine racemase